MPRASWSIELEAEIEALVETIGGRRNERGFVAAIVMFSLNFRVTNEIEKGSSIALDNITALKQNHGLRKL